MNYLDMPIWQINQLVHNYVECKGNYRVTFENHKCQWIDKKTGETFEFKMNEAKEKLKDKRYCSDINIAWPIILECCMDIELSHPLLGGTGTCTIYNPKGTDWQVDFNDNSDSIKAAMICFIMHMKDNN